MTSAADLVRPEIRAMSAYTVHDSAGLVKLDAMENPYGWPPDMEADWLEHLRGLPLNRYPDPAASGLKRRLRDLLGVERGDGILLGNGSDELIQIVQLGAVGRDGVVAAPTPSFVMYEMTSRFVGARFVGVPLLPDFALDLDAMLGVVRNRRPSVVYLAHPNNPTGNLFDRGAIRQIIREAPGIVVVDEAYHAFAGDTFLHEIGNHANLIVMRTLSKLGLAGLRLGYMVGPAALLDELEKVRLPYNVSTLNQCTAEFALGRMEVFEGQASRLVAERDRVFAFLESTDGVAPYPSRANFILFRCERLEASVLFDRLLDSGILVRGFRGAGTALNACLRVTVGTPAENDAFMGALHTVLGDEPRR